MTRFVTACALGLIFASSAPAAAPPTEATYRKLCRSIQARHVRALFTSVVAPIRLGGSSDCAFFPQGSAGATGVRVFLRIDDGDKTLWNHRGDRPYGTFRALTRSGLHAKWGYQGGRIPSVVDARKGTFTCTLIPFGSETAFALAHGSPLKSAQLYANGLLQLCADVFAAYG
jgi:hypothetical protein